MLPSFDYPAPTAQQKNDGWEIRFEYLNQIKNVLDNDFLDTLISLEDIEKVLLAVKILHDKGLA